MELTDKSSPEFKRSRFMYILQAALEYFIAILVEGTFLARITKELGFSDGLTGIISSFISLGCLFQLLSMFIRRKRAKKFVISLTVVNQLMFMLLYVIPVTPLSKTLKTVCFLLSILLAYFLYNIVNPKKLTWLMESVDDKKRGKFTATKEMVSLASGIAFTYGMGAVVDRYKDMGEIRTAFIICAAVIFILTVAETLTLIFVVEIPHENEAPVKNPFKGIAAVFKEKIVLQVALLYVIYYIGNYAAASFLGSYSNNELGFDQRFSVIIASLGSIARMIFSQPFGRYGDKRSFASLIKICLVISAVSYLFAALATPTILGTVNIFGWELTISVGSVCMLMKYLLHGVAMAGLNSALLNIVFDYVPESKRSDSLAFCHSAGGIAGFLTVTALAPLVTAIQNAGNTFLGIPVYAQQVTCIIGIIFIVAAALYVSLVITKAPKNR